MTRACLAAVLLLAPAAARAQEPDQPLFPYGSSTLPADGGVLVLTLSAHVGQTAKALPTTLEVLGPDGTPVAGSVREIGWVQDVAALSLSQTAFIGAGLVWSPDAPLTEGKRYTASARLDAASEPGATAELTAGPAWNVREPELDVEVEATVVTLAAEVTHCCQSLPGGSGGDGCFVYQHDALPALSPRITTDAPLETLQQFTWRYRARGPEPDDKVWESAWITQDSPMEQVPFPSFDRGQLCLDLDARHLVTSEVFTWSACLPEGELPPGVEDPTEGIHAGLDVERCAIPELGDVLQWCALNAERCADAADPACAAYAAACDGEPRDFAARIERWARESYPEIADAGDAATPSAVTHADGGPPHEPSASGCDCRAAGVPATHAGPLVLALLTLAVRRSKT